MHNEEHILKAVANGDKEAFKKLYNLFSAKVYQLALNYTQNIQEAEEVTMNKFSIKTRWFLLIAFTVAGIIFSIC